jgi:hypothetical protein
LPFTRLSIPAISIPFRLVAGTGCPVPACLDNAANIAGAGVGAVRVF